MARRIPKALTLASVLLALSTASAAVIDYSNLVIEQVPASVEQDATWTRDNAIFFTEQDCMLLNGDVVVNNVSVIVAANHPRVSCTFIHADVDGNHPNIVYDKPVFGQMEFDNTILYTASTASELDQTDMICPSGVTYPLAGADLERGLENGDGVFPTGTYLTFVLDRRDGYSDQIRVFTDCP